MPKLVISLRLKDQNKNTLNGGWEALKMKHIFQQGSDPSRPTLLLLHGTGGDEQDLLPLAGRIDEKASVLSVRGNVLENGMPRFFKRLAEGVFDEEDLVFRTNELNEFLDQAAEEYKFDRHNIVAIGYSNGANIAGSLMFHYQDALRGAILHHPMVPRRGVELPDLSGKPVFIGAGTNDPICPAHESEELKSLLEKANASVQLHWENHGHQLTFGEVDAAEKWYNANI
jgi:phospholipase/carboxylesterase